MFPSSNDGLSDLLSYNSDQSVFHRSFINDISPNSKQEEPPLSFFHFPSPFIHYDLELEDHKFFLQQQYYDLLLQPQSLTTDDSTVPDIVNMADSSKAEGNELTKDCSKRNQTVRNQQIPRKRPSKKDRHSKIYTAKGLRDRRMRLSLEVAGKFFRLQDLLGFDKASKTVEWLLFQARAEIKKLERRLAQMNYCLNIDANIASSTSECEVVSGFDKDGTREGIISKEKPAVKEKKIRTTRKIIHRPLARDSRDKARARARERTSKKLWSRRFDESKLADEAKAKDLSQLGSSSSFEAGKELGTESQGRNHSSKALVEVEEPSSNDQHKLGDQEQIFDDAFVIMGKWNQASALSYLQNFGISQEVS